MRGATKVTEGAEGPDSFPKVLASKTFSPGTEVIQTEIRRTRNSIAGRTIGNEIKQKRTTAPLMEFFIKFGKFLNFPHV